MVKKEFNVPAIKPEYGETLSIRQTSQIVMNVLEQSGIVIGPSDSGYVIMASPHHPKAIQALDAILGHGNTPIPLAVASLQMATKYINFGAVHQRLAEVFWPGQLTIVSDVLLPRPRNRNDPNTRAIAQRLHADKTLGLRLSRSSVERQLSAEADVPLTTAAIRDLQGNLINDFDTAMDFVMHRLPLVGDSVAQVPIQGIRTRNKIPFTEHSTVVSFPASGPQIHREGAISTKSIWAASATPAFGEYADAT